MRCHQLARLASLSLACIAGCGGPVSGGDDAFERPDVAIDAFRVEVDASRGDADIDAARADAGADAFTAGDAGTDAAGACGPCDDGVACTIDRCVGVTCQHTIAHGLCTSGQYCDAALGCRPGGACARATDCMRPDACVTVTCDASSARCVYAVLDGDFDGHAPEVCGGDDCDDASAIVYGGAEEACDLADQDCDMRIDEDNATTTACGDLSTCTDGTCSCPAALDWCYYSSFPFSDFRCVDVRTDPLDCGGCGFVCADGIACVDGACDCPGTTSSCPGGCFELSNDPNNCGACGTVCPSGVSCVAGRCDCGAGRAACGALCTDLLTDDTNCGSCGNYCPSGVTCTAGRCPCAGGVTTCDFFDPTCSDLNGRYCGSCDHICDGTCAAGVCSCPAGLSRCERLDPEYGGQVTCTSFANNPSTCGGCNHACAEGEDCVAGVCMGCIAPYIECGGRPGPHCVDPRNDPSNCGSCGHVCRLGVCNPTGCLGGG